MLIFANHLEVVEDDNMRMHFRQRRDLRILDEQISSKSLRKGLPIAEWYALSYYQWI
jgi:hypothetical protein